jgi:hypothetical protein
MNTKLKELANCAVALCLPFVNPESNIFLDWDERLSLINDYLDIISLQSSEFPIFEIDFANNPVQEITLADARKFLILQTNFDHSTKLKRAVSNFSSFGDSYSVSYTNLQSNIDPKVFEMFKKVLSVERLAISACSSAISKFKITSNILILFLEVIRDEFLHLQSLATLTGINPLEELWISESRQPAWNAIVQCETLLEYVLLQHCMFEGEGCLSAHLSIFEAKRLSFSSNSLSIIERIAVEELRHATVGYFIAKIIVSNNEELTKAKDKVINLIRSIEPLKEESTFKGKKQRLAVKSLNEFVTNNDWHGTNRKLTLTCHEIALNGTF